MTGGIGRRARIRTVPRVLCIAVVTSLLIAATGCGLGDKQARADVVIDAVERALNAGTATGTLHVATHIVELPPSIAALGRAGGEGGPTVVGTDVPAVTTDVQLDLDRRQASVALPGGVPFQLHDDLVLFGRRHAASERDARPWLRVDLESLAEGDTGLSPQDDHPAMAAFAINPVLLLELMTGPLSGSVDPGTVEDIDGVPTRRYDANFDTEKAMRKIRRSHFPEERRRAVEDLFDTLEISGVVHPGHLWVDGDGMPRRILLRLRQQPQRDLRVDLVLQLDLATPGAPVSVETPSIEQRLETASVVQFLRAVVLLPDAPADGSIPPGAIEDLLSSEGDGVEP